MLIHQLAPFRVKRSAASCRWKPLPTGTACAHRWPTWYIHVVNRHQRCTPVSQSLHGLTFHCTKILILPTGRTVQYRGLTRKCALNSYPHHRHPVTGRYEQCNQWHIGYMLLTDVTTSATMLGSYLRDAEYQFAASVIGSRVLSFSDHYCQLTCRNVILSFCHLCRR